MHLSKIGKNLSRYWQNLRLCLAAQTDNISAYERALFQGADPLHDSGKHIADQLVSSQNPAFLNAALAKIDYKSEIRLLKTIINEGLKRGTKERDPYTLGRVWYSLLEGGFVPKDETLVYLSEKMIDISNSNNMKLVDLGLDLMLPKSAPNSAVYVDALCRLSVHAAKQCDSRALNTVLGRLAPYFEENAPIRIKPDYVDTYPNRYNHGRLTSASRPTEIIACSINNLGVAHLKTAELTRILDFKLRDYAIEETVGSLVDAVVVKAPESLTRDHVLSLVEQGQYDIAMRIVTANTLLEEPDYTTIMHRAVAQPTPSAPLADLMADVFNRGVDTPNHAETWADMLEKKDFPSIGAAECRYLGLAAHIKDACKNLTAGPITTPSASEAFAPHADPIKKRINEESIKEVRRSLPERFTV